jgi:hypothetical protein
MNNILAPADALDALSARPESPLLTSTPENPASRGPVVLALHGTETSTAPIVFANRIAQRLRWISR